MTKYKRKAQYVKAVKFTGNNIDEVLSILPDSILIFKDKGKCIIKDNDGFRRILDKNDYVVWDGSTWYVTDEECLLFDYEKVSD